MTILETENLDLDVLRALREQQASEIELQPMGHHEMVAYYGGFPPSTSVMNPSSLRTGLINGTIEPSQSPIAKAEAHLESTLGPRAEMTVRAKPEFSLVSGSSQDAKPLDLSFGNNPTAGPS